MIKIKKIFSHRSIIVYLLLFSLFNCSSGAKFSRKSKYTRGYNKEQASQYRINQLLKGECSYYADKFHGRKTANGEIYDMHGFTAAHKSLPFNTILDVKNLKNGKIVRVRVNDRGPYKKGRILDLSLSAAKKIGLVQSGVTQIEAKIIKLGKK
jgi:rare lipoprotein A